MQQKRTKTVLAALAACHLLVLVVLVLFPPDYGEGRLAEFLILGLLFGQLGVAAVWMAWGAQAFSLRVWLATAMALAVCAVLVIPVWRMFQEVAVIYGAIFLGQWVAVQVPLWGTRVFLGWRLAKPAQDDVSAIDNGLQYGLKHLLGWTLAIAILLGTGRWLMPDEGFFGDLGAVGSQIVVPLCLLTAFSLLIALSAIAGGLVERKVWLWIPVSFATAAVVTAALQIVYQLRADMDADIWQTCTLNGAHWAWLLGSMVVLRLGGYRLSRRRTGGARTQ